MATWALKAAENFLLLLFIGTGEINGFFNLTSGPNFREYYKTELDNDDFNLTTIVANNNSVVIYGFDELIAFDSNGKVKWKKDDTILPHFNLVISDDDALFLATQKNILSVNLKNGDTNWQQEIEGIYHATSRDQGLSIRPIVFKLLSDKKSLAVVVGMTKRGNEVV